MTDITYRNTLEDHIEFNQYHLTHSRTGRNSRMVYMWTPPVIWAFFALAAGLSAGSVPIALVVLVVVSAGWLAIGPRIWRKRIASSTRKLLAEGQNAGLGVDQQLRLSLAGLEFSSSRGDGTVNWSAVEKIALSPNAVYLYVSAVNAIMVPRREFDEPGAFEAFVEEARRLREQAVGLISA